MPAGWSYFRVQKQYGYAHSNVGQILGPEGIVIENPLDHERRNAVARPAQHGEAIAIRHRHNGDYEGAAPEYRILMPPQDGLPVDHPHSYERMIEQHNAMFTAQLAEAATQ